MSPLGEFLPETPTLDPSTFPKYCKGQDVSGKDWAFLMDQVGECYRWGDEDS